MLPLKSISRCIKSTLCSSFNKRINVASSQSKHISTSTPRLSSQESESSDHLECCVLADEDKPKIGSIIFLHGLGGDGESMMDILKKVTPPGLTYYFPNAPEMAISSLKGHKFRSWFDVHSFEMDDRNALDVKGLQRSVERVKEIVEYECEDIGAHRVAVAGMAIGGTVATALGLTFPKTLGGVLTINPFTPAYKSILPSGNQVTPEARKTPFYSVHGQQDDIVPAEHAKVFSQYLKEELNIETAESVFDPSGGHEISEEMLRLYLRFVAQVFYPERLEKGSVPKLR